MTTATAEKEQTGTKLSQLCLTARKLRLGAGDGRLGRRHLFGFRALLELIELELGLLNRGLGGSNGRVRRITLVTGALPARSVTRCLLRPQVGLRGVDRELNGFQHRSWLARRLPDEVGRRAGCESRMRLRASLP